MRLPLRRLAVPAVALALLPAMILLSRDFGATWDERALQKYGEEIWNVYTGRAPRSSIDISFGYMRFYGALVEVLSVAAQRLVPADLWVVRHAVNSVFGWVGSGLRLHARAPAVRRAGRRGSRPSCCWPCRATSASP